MDSSEMVLGMKTCGRCRATKELVLFRSNKGNACGLDSWCRACNNAYDKERALRPDRQLTLKAQQAKRRAMLAGVTKDMLAACAVRVLEYHSNPCTCVYCGEFLPTGAEQVDHVRPVAVHGAAAHVPWNLVPACGACNGSKGKKDLMSWIKSRRAA